MEEAVFSPPIDEGRWVRQGPRSLESGHTSSQVAIIYFTPKIFQVPKPLKESKPDAYTPQTLGLGPYHHLRPDLHRTHQKKLAQISLFQARGGDSPKTQFFSQEALRRVRDIEPLVRVQYDKYLDLEGSTLEHIFLLDSFFLFDFLGLYKENMDVWKFDTGHKEVVKDVLMLENQIPKKALEEVGKEIGLFSPERDTTTKMLYAQLFYCFCKAHSPLKLSEWACIDGWGTHHLLSFMYSSIISNRPITPEEEKLQDPEAMGVTTRRRIERALSELRLGGPSMQSFLGTPAVAKNKKQERKTRVISRRVIPSATELSKMHEVVFRVLKPDEGIGNIGFTRHLEGEKPTIHLPEITFRFDSEVILRNLLAYEAAVDGPEPLGRYVDLMIDLLQTAQDVAMLRQRGIVKGDTVSDGEIVEIFRGIGKSGANPTLWSTTTRVVDEVKSMVDESKMTVLVKNWTPMGF
ncbi:unnamed protein product [Cuscuta epithymum]|uniref:Uncharacterized protein n=1 Tax=Cuscuta epithymum TaxID=186058 RepID=A0AAV0F2W2_9ASTE|nr:unnamed protein product [Cuscuta epithymum]